MTKLLLLPLLLAVSTASLPAQQQTIYVKIDGVSVPGTTGIHQDELRVLSFETNETVPVSTTTVTGATVTFGKVSFANMQLSTAFNAWTNAILSLRTAAGTRITGAELRFYDGANQVTSKIELGEVVVVGVKTSGADSDMMQQLDLAFSRIRWWATAPGSTLKAVSGWDMAKSIQW